ncbi:MAG TPA: alpha/beta fold hydrolase [Gemmatimonadales bacterium]|jgi:Predicted hydrolases or acyltransferases (alpha/beta hydrolase superfamily)
MLSSSTATATPVSIAEEPAIQQAIAPEGAVRYGSLDVDGLSIAYRESGRPGAPKLVLLHGFPASSHQYRNLVQALADRFHVLAPDYPGFGLSDRPDPATWPYTFDHLAEVTERFLALKGFEHYGLFVQDYGGPVGFRIVSRRPEALEWLIIQNSNAYEEGFTAAWDGLRGALWQGRSPETEAPLHAFLSPETIRTIYLHGTRRPELLSPDAWESDTAFMQRPHAVRINLDLFYDYRTNVPLYPAWQRFLRERQPKTIIFWGQQDLFFTPAGGEAYLADLPDSEMHRLDAGHFAVEDHLEYIADRMRGFYDEQVSAAP